MYCTVLHYIIHCCPQCNIIHCYPQCTFSSNLRIVQLTLSKLREICSECALHSCLVSFWAQAQIPSDFLVKFRKIQQNLAKLDWLSHLAE
jgi:hypothetical protein